MARVCNVDQKLKTDFTAEVAKNTERKREFVWNGFENLSVFRSACSVSSAVKIFQAECRFPMPDAKPRWRLDAVAWTLLAMGVVLAIAIGTHPPLTAQAPAFGPDSTAAVSAFANAIGYAAFVFVVGWFFIAFAYIARRGWPRMFIRTVGWYALTATAATVLDYQSARLPHPASVYGAGGSVGAYLRFQIDENVPPQYANFALIGAAIVSLLLVADHLVWLLFRKLFAALLFGNRLIEVGSNKVLSALASGGRKPPVSEGVNSISIPKLTTQVTHSTPPVPKTETGGLRPPLAGDVPIISHTEVVDLTPVGGGDQETITEFQLPSLSLLKDPDAFPVEDHESFLRDRAALLEKTFAEFAINIKVVGIHTGPVITQYEISLETGLRLNKVTTMSEDIALKLKVPSVRIIAPLPGRDTVGVEVPNELRQTVRLKELILATQAKAAKMKLPLFLGKDVEGRPLCYDLADMPHLLIAGRTGTGKSVCLNTVLQSFLFTRSPDECRLILIDPKQVEFSGYSNIPHLMHPVVTKNEKAEAILGWAVDKMTERYELLRRARVRNIASYNELTHEELLRRIDPQSEEERQKIPRKIPYVVIVIDELGDLLIVMKKEVESHIVRLAQLARAAGIHLILATQRPTADVVTGLIKSNLPARICFQVSSRTDSAVVLDEKGAEKLLGRGDMLFLQPGTSTLIRGQGAYVDDQEIESVTADISLDTPNYDTELLNVKARTDGPPTAGDLSESLRSRDEMYEQAIEIVIREQRGSTSLLQRALGIGYGRASRLIDFMAEDSIVGGFNGSNARDVLVTAEEWEARKAGVG
jgi:DNA segregation ATPase FtsK/SpoIIIE, S-DNA-T family